MKLQELEIVKIYYPILLQIVFIDYLAGTVGIFMCVAATVFFVPRMLEKGAADPLFSKPVSRWSLLFAR